MIKNYFKIAFRNLWKNRGFSAINIAGLTLAITCFVVILLFIKNELSFDRYHKNANDIYRVVKDFVNDDGTKIPDATTPPALAPVLQKDLPEVAYVTRLVPNWGREYLIENGEKRFYETSLLRVDSFFFKVFDFSFISGNKINALRDDHAIILTETAAKKYFGNENPLGKTLSININNGANYIVTGVLKDIPPNSHFTFDFLIPFVSRRRTDDWNWYIFYTYVLLKPNAITSDFNRKLQQVFKKYQPESSNIYYSQPLTDIHLRSHLKWELGSNNDVAYIQILMIIAIFIIVVAGINYVNLVTAQSAKRAKEVGVRKVAGATKTALIKQFLIESVLMAFTSFFTSLLAVYSLLPFANKLLESKLQLFSAEQWPVWFILVMITLLIGVLAGLYPAFYLSSFQPVKALKEKIFSSYRGAWLRKSLVVFQFVISIALVAAFLIIYQQVAFITRKNLGFDKDNILLLPNVRGTGVNSTQPGSMVEELKTIPAVTSLARADGILGGLTSTNGVSSKHNNNHISLNFIRIDHEFLPTLQIKLTEGRNFFSSTTDSTAIIVNHKAIEQLGLKPPYLGQLLNWDDEEGKTHPVSIIGIAEDFHFMSLHDPIKPFGFIQEEDNGNTFFLKLHSQNLQTDIAAIRHVWEKYNSDKPFEYSFQDEQISKLYQSDVKFERIFSCLTAFAVSIACLGLLGLSLFAAEARAKEIGVRKVLGASMRSLFSLLSREFLSLVGIAILIASPLAWWVMNDWLRNFAYHIHIELWFFIVAGFMALLIALLTICFQTFKAAIANPVKSLRTE